MTETFLKIVKRLCAVVIIGGLVSCNGSVGVSAGIKKDGGSGLTSTYKNMEPEKVYLSMNDEVLNHTDIPLGEKFLIINENVQGLKEREGKISMGCALTISDERGKVLLEEKDLFASNDIFNPKDAELLRCTVTTGEPMQWEEKYKVLVKFWDKYGDGYIESKVTIKAIDIP